MCLAIIAEKTSEWTTLSHSKRAELAELRRRAFTLLFLRWEELRRAVAFLRFEEGDPAEVMPSLRVQTKGRALAAAVEATAADVIEAPKTAPTPVAPAPKADCEVAPKPAVA